MKLNTKELLTDLEKSMKILPKKLSAWSCKNYEPSFALVAIICGEHQNDLHSPKTLERNLLPVGP